MARWAGLCSPEVTSGSLCQLQAGIRWSLRPGLLMLHPPGSFGGSGASACRSPLTQGCTPPGLGV